jgi:TonB family protein
MTWWQYLLLVNLYLVLFYGFYALLLRSETFFQLNRIYLVSSALLSFFIPVIHADWIRQLFITQKVQYQLFAYDSPAMVYRFKPIADHHITIEEAAIFIYAAGALVLLVRFIWQLISLKRIINQPIPSGAFSFFKSIRLGENVGDLENRDVIAAHELVHANEFHSADILLMEAISIINWFNPVVYLYRVGIRHIHEFIADSRALKNGADKADYALLLLSQTLKTPAHQLVNPFFSHSLLKRRIIMLQKNRSQRTALLKYGLSAPLFISMLILSSATIAKSRTVMLFDNKVLFNTKGALIKSKPVRNAVIEADTTPSKRNDGPIFTAVEKAPEFTAGIEAFYRFLSQNIKYPEAMRKNNIEGKVFITFIVEKDGSLSDIKSVRDVGYGSAEESIRVLKLSPKWSPGYQNGIAVRVQYTMPISFTLGNDKTAKDTVLKTGDASKKDLKTGYSVANMFYHSSKDTIKKYAVVFSNNLYDPQLQPIFILDGKEITGLSSVNPDDIESISVLKQNPNDNSLVTLYGAKAKNGVVLIKTKKAAVKLNPAH